MTGCNRCGQRLVRHNACENRYSGRDSLGISEMPRAHCFAGIYVFPEHTRGMKTLLLQLVRPDPIGGQNVSSLKRISRGNSMLTRREKKRQGSNDTFGERSYSFLARFSDNSDAHNSQNWRTSRVAIFNT